MFKAKAVVFDIDGTLAPDISWELLTEELGASLVEHRNIYRNFLLKKNSVKDTKRQLLALWLQTGRANRGFIQEKLYEWRLYPESAEIVSYLGKKQKKLCLITGSFDLYAQSVSDRLGIPDFFANGRLIWDTEGNLVDFCYTGDQAKLKLRHFKTFCKKYNLQKEECVVVGDSANDTELFSYTGRGIVVPSANSGCLKDIAWKSVKSLHELTEIL